MGEVPKDMQGWWICPGENLLLSDLDSDEFTNAMMMWFTGYYNAVVAYYKELSGERANMPPFSGFLDAAIEITKARLTEDIKKRGQKFTWSCGVVNWRDIVDKEEEK